MIRLVAVAVVAVTACTPQHVTSWAESHGIVIAGPDAAAISQLATRDCLPRYNSGVYVECAIADAAAKYGVDRATLADLAWCESRHQPDAANPVSSATGLFQFLSGTWAWVAGLGAPHASGRRVNARANADTAAWLIARPELGGIGHWVCAP